MTVEPLPEQLPSRDFLAMLEETETYPENLYIGISSMEMKPVSVPIFEKRYLAVTCEDVRTRTQFIEHLILMHAVRRDSWKGQKFVIITQNASFRNILLNTYGIKSKSQILKEYVPDEPIPEGCLLNLCDIPSPDEQNRVLKELASERRIVITENFPSFYQILGKMKHEAFFQNFAEYFMNIYQNTVQGVWINCLSEVDLAPRNEFLLYQIENRGYAALLSEENMKNTQIGIGQRINERNLNSIDLEYISSSLPMNQAWVRENGKYFRILCPET